MYIMPWTKEKKAEYDRAYRLANKEKAADQHRAYYLKNKEKVADQWRAYKLENPEKVMIGSWRQQGHFIPVGTEHAAYTRFRDTTHCEFCNWELVSGGKRTTNTKCRHHDHNIEGKDNFIAIICQNCNLREKCNNTSGEPNIYYKKARGKWVFQISYFDRWYNKATFTTFEDALAYKAAWFALNSPNVFHDPAWEMELP